MEHEKPIFSGNLRVPAAGKLKKKSWHQKYCMLFKSGKFGVARLEIYDSADSTKQIHKINIITLQDCIKIIPRNSTCFAIATNAALHEFEALSSLEMDEWLSSLQSVCFPDNCSKVTSVEEDNDLYCPSGEGIFNVKLHSSPASIRCGLEAKQYLLFLTNNGVQLKNCHDNKLLFNWPYCFIRRYGYKNGMFTFEAGRKCESGEGIFYLQHSDQQEIFRCFSSKIKSMKKLLSNETLPTIFDMEPSFHSALSMEARSRSPLPTCLTSLSSLNDIDQNSSSKSQISDFSDVLANKLKTMGRPIPTKPPRKNIPLKDESSKELYEAVNKYEEIEYISEAWKTMGVNEVPHSESQVADPEEEYMSWGGLDKKEVNKNVTTIKAPKIILEPKKQENYDKLNFFGSKSKSNNSSSYKQVEVSSFDSLNPPSFNDYAEIDLEPMAQGITSKDKKIVKNFKIVKQPLVKLKDGQVSHQFHNNEPYAIISKPKQV